MNATEQPVDDKKKTCACCGVTWEASRENQCVDKIEMAKEGATPVFLTFHKRCYDFVLAACDRAVKIYGDKALSERGEIKTSGSEKKTS